MLFVKRWVMYFQKRLSRKRAMRKQQEAVLTEYAERQKGVVQPPRDGPAHFIPFPKS
jgi:hypothetical protein